MLTGSAVYPMLARRPEADPAAGTGRPRLGRLRPGFCRGEAFDAKNGSARTAAQTDTALFFNANAVLQFRVGLRDQVMRRGLDIVESSRAFILLTTTTADALISVWRAKYDYTYWRPITAIQLADTDGNQVGHAVSAWATAHYFQPTG